MPEIATYQVRGIFIRYAIDHFGWARKDAADAFDQWLEQRREVARYPLHLHSGDCYPGAHRISGRHLMSEVVEAFIREYGHRPENRREQDLYGAFRFGYEAGQKSGAREERDRIKKVIGDD